MAEESDILGASTGGSISFDSAATDLQITLLPQMPAPWPFVVPFSRRNATDGIFASHSRGIEGDSNARLQLVLKQKDFNVHLLQNNSNIVATRSFSPIVALVTLQGSIGVPKLLAYHCGAEKNPTHYYLIDTANFTEMPEPMLPLKVMIAQYAKALIEQHKHCVSLGRDLDFCWQGQEIKFIEWDYCGFRGDCGSDFPDMPADSLLDMYHFGLTIKEWSEKLNSTEYVALANALLNTCPYQRLSPEFVLLVLEDPSLLDKVAKLARQSLKNALEWCSEAELNDFVIRKMSAAAKEKTIMNLKNIEWTDELKKGVRRGTAALGTDRIVVIGKTLQIACTSYWGPALEFFVTKWMQGKNFFPKLLDYEFFYEYTNNERSLEKLLLIFPEYNKEPKQRDIFRTARQLLTAVKTLQEKRIIHSDIAPPNVMWDNNDDLVLIDFGSTFWFNFIPAYESNVFSQCMLRDYGHEGFVPPEKVRFAATDVFSAGRLIEHWANEWNQMTPELNSLIQAMTYDEWYRRVDLDDALARLEQIEQYQYQKACEIEETNHMIVQYYN